MYILDRKVNLVELSDKLLRDYEYDIYVFKYVKGTSITADELEKADIVLKAIEEEIQRREMYLCTRKCGTRSAPCVD